jgi:spore germination protein KB
MGVFMAYHNQPRLAFKVKAAAVITSSLLMLIAYGAALAVFGQALFTTVIHVSYNIARLISIRGFFERVEALIMTLWVLGGFLSIAIVYYAATLGTAQILHLKSFRPLVPLLGVVILAASQWQFPNRVAADFFVSHIFVWLALAVEAGLTSLLLLVSWLRQPGKRAGAGKRKAK